MDTFEAEVHTPQEGVPLVRPSQESVPLVDFTALKEYVSNVEMRG